MIDNQEKAVAQGAAGVSFTYEMRNPTLNLPKTDASVLMSYQAVRPYLSGKPLRRPNRTKPAEYSKD